MLKRILIIYLVVNSGVLSQDEILEYLYGSNGLNRLTICSDEAIDCEAALWKPRWVLARTTCIYDIPLWQLAVLKGDKACAEFMTGIGWNTARTVHASFRFPNVDEDLTLLYMDASFGTVERVANETAAREVLQTYESWLHNTMHRYLYGNSDARSVTDAASPVQMFITVGVLPSAALIILYLFILFFTRPNKKTLYYEPQNYHFKEHSSV